MKKFLAISLLSLTLLLSGCGSNSSNSNTTTTDYPEDTVVKTYYFDEELTDADIEALKSEEGVYNVTVNEDGSITLVISSESLEETRLTFLTEVQTYIDECVAEKVTPSIVDLHMNGNMTAFEMFIDADEVTVPEILLVEELLNYATSYQKYFGDDTQNTEISFTIYNSNDEVIEKYTSSNFYESVGDLLSYESLSDWYEQNEE